MVMNANVVASVVNKISTGGSDDRATDGVYGNRTLGDEFWFVRFDKFDEAVSRDNPPARAVGESGDGADRGFGRWRRVTAHA
jgi:hypothetical protein